MTKTEKMVDEIDIDWLDFHLVLDKMCVWQEQIWVNILYNLNTLCIMIDLFSSLFITKEPKNPQMRETRKSLGSELRSSRLGQSEWRGRRKGRTRRRPGRPRRPRRPVRVRTESSSSITLLGSTEATLINRSWITAKTQSPKWIRS